MKKVLITGQNSYIGNAFATYVSENVPDIVCTKVSLREGIENISFTGYDAVLHVAGIAHVDVKKADEKTKETYYAVNRDLAGAVAKKAAAQGVSHFINLSSAIVYGDSAPIGKQLVLHKETEPAPVNFYGDSKLQGELAVKEAARNSSMKVSTIRPPMVYGRGAKGNFPKLLKLSGKTPIFPRISNARSMIYIENLCALISILIVSGEEGLFLPQDKETVSTAEMVKQMAAAGGRKLHLVPGCTWAFLLLAHVSGYVNKIFGNMTYASEDSLLPSYLPDYRIYTTQQAIDKILQPGERK